jgi:hypothetical protein
LRQIEIQIADGTAVNTLQCNAINLWNGDTIAAVDNIAKNSTTSGWTLNAGGTQLKIEKSVLSGNVVMAHGTLAADTSGLGDATLYCKASANDIVIDIETAGVAQDLTARVDIGEPIIVVVLYLTDA